MTNKPFYHRLKGYFLDVSKVLKGEADAASIFPNSSDIGLSREHVYVKFLRQHLPSKCNVFLGGFLFGEDGNESKQLDVIISTDTAPRFDFHNQDGKGKSFGPVEGCLAVASIKSRLDRDNLIDALEGIASIPETKSLEGRVNPNLTILYYEEWPYKIIYASNGLNIETILAHLNDFYETNPDIPTWRRPDLIHIAGKGVIFKAKSDMHIANSDFSVDKTPWGKYVAAEGDPDVQAICWTLHELQFKAAASTHILFKYSYIINNVVSIH